MQTLLPSLLPGDSAVTSIPLWLVTDGGCAALLQSLPPAQADWARAMGFAAERHKLLLLPAADGAVGGALWGLGAVASADGLTPWDAAALPERLPAGSFRLASGVGVSWKSPMGPIKIDFGVPIMKNHYDEREVVHVSFGTKF